MFIKQFKHFNFKHFNTPEQQAMFRVLTITSKVMVSSFWYGKGILLSNDGEANITTCTLHTCQSSCHLNLSIPSNAPCGIYSSLCKLNNTWCVTVYFKFGLSILEKSG